MEYIINSTRQENEILITNVTMTLDSGDVLDLEVAHFLPKSFDEIHQNIINRSISEQSRLNAINNISNLMNKIPINQTILI